ncbi:MAG TPA: FtsX-like permease family protein [Gaiellaceae bacterium]|nr:FtsX-like permease family protein [Gaiellaceae bacterium]
MTWPSLIWKNLRRRPARTAFTAVGVGLGVGLIVALLAITNGVHRTAGDLMHVGRADFGLYQAEVSDFTRSLLPESLAAKVASDPGVAAVAKIKLLVDGGMLVFGLDSTEFAARRLVVVAGERGPVLAGDHSGKHVGQVIRVAGRPFTISGLYHSGDRFEDLGIVLPLRTVESLAQRPGEITSLGVTVKLGQNVKAVAGRLQRLYPGIAAITEPGQAIKVDTSSRLIISTGWIVSILALIVGGIGVMNTMAMSVFERTREIGVLRAVGWSAARVAAMVLSEAVGICLIALAVGCGLGVLAAEQFVSRSQLSGLISPVYSVGTFVWGLVFALGVAVFGALYPTWRAVRLAPIAALRHE